MAPPQIFTSASGICFAQHLRGENLQTRQEITGQNASLSSLSWRPVWCASRKAIPHGLSRHPAQLPCCLRPRAGALGRVSRLRAGRAGGRGDAASEGEASVPSIGKALMEDSPSPERISMSHHPSKHPSYAGPTACLRCDRTFRSWDRRQNRLCPRCLEYLKAQPSDEDRYVPPNRRDLPQDA
jgi:hypothetical protein